jgi:ribulose-phosphate 3-epimerase
MLAINPGTPISVMEEVLPDLDAVLVMTVNPGFAGQKLVPQTLDKIRRLRKWLDESGYGHIEIEVDGNVNYPNARLMSEAGANIFVAGTSSLYAKGTDLDEEIVKFRDTINLK